MSTGVAGGSHLAAIACLPSEHHHLRECERIGVLDGQEGRRGADRAKATGGATVQLKLRGAAVADHLDVAPQHTLGMARAERLHRRFLGGEATGEVGHRIPATRTIGDLPFGEYALEKSLAVLIERARDAREVGHVNT